MAACLSGNEAAWRSLLGRYQGFIYGLACRMGLSAADADDVFQDTCIKLVQHLNDLRDTDRLAGWLASVVRQEVWRRARRRSARAETSPLEMAAELPCDPSAPGADPEESVLQWERLHLIRRALRTLSPECRNLLDLLYGSEPMSYQDVSRALSLPLGSIGPQRGRCLARLRKQLEGQGE